MTIEVPADLATALRQAESVAVLTGAGISAESGVPTFRDQQSGFWAQFRPEDLATLEGFLRQPKIVCDWYEDRRRLYARVRPNAGHHALVVIEQSVPRFALITQNIDGLHQAAGSRRAIELHGSVHRMRRLSDGKLYDSWDRDQSPPLCPETGEMLRPDVVWFGEMLPVEVLEAAAAAARSCDLFLCVGTSSTVYPAAALPYEAAASGAAVLEVNPEPTPLSDDATWVLRAPAGEALPALVAAAWPETAAR